MKQCCVNNCINKHYAKGYCHNHYEIWRRNGSIEYKTFRSITGICSVEGCNRKHRAKGYCDMHYIRMKNHGTIEKSTPKGNKNINWKGGITEYPNHYLMKLNRKLVLENQNHICRCGKKANQIHHLDYNKSNHNLSNLVGLCKSCHVKLHPIKKSKYLNIYGKTCIEISKILDLSVYKIRILHNTGQLIDFLCHTGNKLTIREIQ